MGALAGLDGVEKVEKGFHLFKEYNRVYFDPAQITVDEMESTLKQVRTYRSTGKIQIPVKNETVE